MYWSCGAVAECMFRLCLLCMLQYVAFWILIDGLLPADMPHIAMQDACSCVYGMIHKKFFLETRNLSQLPLMR